MCGTLFGIGLFIRFGLQLPFSTNVLVLLPLWGGLVWCISAFSSEAKGKIFWWTALFYPFLAFLFQLWIAFDVIPYSWVYINILEHFFWTFSTTLLFFPLINHFFSGVSRGKQVVVLFLLLMTIGMINEMAEYVVRDMIGRTKVEFGLIYYTDTIRDFLVNIFGAGVGGMVVWGNKGEWKSSEA